MSILTIRQPQTPWFFDRTTPGASEAAGRVPTKHSEYLAGFAGGSATGVERIGNPAQAIFEVQAAGAKDDWDSNDAVAIPFEAALQAEQLLLCLPSDIPVPDIFADPTGAICFQWYRKPKHRLVLSIYASGTVEFAGLLGDDEIYGSARMGRGLPRTIRHHLRELFAEEAQAKL